MPSPHARNASTTENSRPSVDPPLSLTLVDPDSPDGQTVVGRFFADIVSRRWGRPPTSAELERVMRDEPSSDLRGETGYLVLVRDETQVVGCGGVRVIEPGVGELTRMFIDPVARGRGGGVAVLRELEAMATARGLSLLRLTVRDDLTEARRLYQRAGYAPVEPFSDSPYADHFLAKVLSRAPRAH